MIKKIVCLLLIGSVFFRNTVVYANNKKTVEIIETVDTEFDKNDWYVTGELEFPVTAEEIQWKEYQTRDEMVAACNLPETLVHEISTDELVRLMLEYPLLGDLMLYDNINTGIEIMSQECNILSELLDREDGAEELLNAYCNLEIEEESLIPEYVLDDISNDYEKLDYYLDNSYIEELIQQSEVNIIQDIFLEGILAQEEFVNKLSDDEIADLANEAEIFNYLK